MMLRIINPYVRSMLTYMLPSIAYSIRSRYIDQESRCIPDTVITLPHCERLDENKLTLHSRFGLSSYIWVDSKVRSQILTKSPFFVQISLSLKDLWFSQI